MIHKKQDIYVYLFNADWSPVADFGTILQCWRHETFEYVGSKNLRTWHVTTTLKVER